jgi:hypothetical protein
VANTRSDSIATMSLILFVPVGILLSLSPYSYAALELLVCWVFLGLFLLALTPAILGVALVHYFGRWIFHWAWTTLRMSRTNTLSLSAPHPRPISGGGRSR